jgi:riboflavin kinase/FMN adenylyltransferase
MILIRGKLHLTRRLSRSVITMGNFDGFHQGHQQLLDLLREQAHSLNAPALVMTFEPLPYEFFHPHSPQARLMRLHEKWRYLQEQKIDYCVCLQFNNALAQMKAEDFVQKILIDQLGMCSIIVGDDFRFGAKRLGDVTLLQNLGQKYGFNCIKASTLMIQNERVSSTRIRRALLSGQVELANALLGRPYFLCGKVVHGEARGRQWDLSTANIHLAGKPVAVSGIYVVQVRGLKEHPLPAVASVGIRPMFSQNRRVILEVHLLNFNQNIYGKQLMVEFLHKLRDEQIFPTPEMLVQQIKTDIENTKLFFGETS